MGLLARGEVGLKEALLDVESCGATGLAVPTDMSRWAQVETAADRVERELGPIDVWVNVAFVGALAFFWDTSPEDYRRMTDVTYYGQVHGTRTALRLMRPRDRGVIVNVSSAMAYRSIPLQSAYCGAKHAIKGMTESVLTELEATGSKVRIGLVTLPGVNTTQFAWNLDEMKDHPQPVPPIVQPEVAARAVRFVAEHKRRNVWVGIATAYTVLGERVAPRFLDWYLGKTGVTAQQTDEDTPRWGENLYEPRDAQVDRGARGAFSSSASTHDPVSFLGRHRRLAGVVAVAATGGIAAAVRRR